MSEAYFIRNGHGADACEEAVQMHQSKPIDYHKALLPQELCMLEFIVSANSQNSLKSVPSQQSPSIATPTSTSMKKAMTFHFLYPELLLLVSGFLDLLSLRNLTLTTKRLNEVFTPALYKRAADCATFYYDSAAWPHPPSPPPAPAPKNWPTNRHRPSFPCARKNPVLQVPRMHHCCAYPYHVFRHIAAAGNYTVLKPFLERYKKLNRHPLKRYALDAAIENACAGTCLADNGGFADCATPGGRTFELREGAERTEERCKIVGYLIQEGANLPKALDALEGLKRKSGQVDVVEMAMAEARQGLQVW